MKKKIKDTFLNSYTIIQNKKESLKLKKKVFFSYDFLSVILFAIKTNPKSYNASRILT